MINHIQYAWKRCQIWLGRIAVLYGLFEYLITDNCLRLGLSLLALSLSFIIPFIYSFKNEFPVKVEGKSKVSLKFGNLFDEDCIVVTTTIYFDIQPTGEIISDESLLGHFVKKYCEDNGASLEKKLQGKLKKDKNCNFKPVEYGHFLKEEVGNKMVYFLAFTDRDPKDQPKDFYVKTLLNFFDTIVKENHGKTICLPLIGDNNNLSDSGFGNSRIAYKSMISMINCFGIINQKSQLNLKIVALPSKRGELIDLL